MGEYVFSQQWENFQKTDHCFSVAERNIYAQKQLKTNNYALKLYEFKSILPSADGCVVIGTGGTGWYPCGFDGKQPCPGCGCGCGWG